MISNKDLIAYFSKSIMIIILQNHFLLISQLFLTNKFYPKVGKIIITFKKGKVDSIIFG